VGGLDQMIIELLLTPLFWLLGLILDLLPDMSGIDPLSGFDISGFIDILAYGFFLFPFPLFMIFVGNKLFWLSAQMIWAIIEWVYRKFPGVN
jgi:hypothetical protein